MINYTTKFFSLELLKISEIKLHETTECSRLRNVYDRIVRSKHLLNPVIVGKYKNEYILIDGANRLSTLKEIGCKLTVAQVIDYMNTKIRLKRWHHLVYGMNISEIIDYCNLLSLKYTEVSYKEGEKIQKEHFNYIIASEIQENRTILIHLNRNFGEMLEQLNNFTKLYFAKYTFDRSEEEIRMSDLKKYTRKKGTLIEFPSFKKTQIIKIANNIHKIPAGITRHILVNRVLHIRYDINKLKNENNIEKKREELNKYLINKIDNNKVRQYRESVIVFDE